MTSHVRGGLVLLGILSVLPITQVAKADDEPALQEVTVTAQKRTENLQDTPISIVALGAAELQQRGISNVADLANSVPDLHIMPFGSASTTLEVFIRGIGQVDSQVTEDSPVAIYLNGVYVARPVGLATDQADIERIEVLRGPQGTLYGRNTTGGAINIITASPTDQLGGSELVSFGNFGAVRTQSMVNLPVTDNFSIRASLDWNRRDGWVTNTGIGADWSSYDQLSGRIDMDWKVNDAVKVDYIYDRGKDVFTSDLYQLTIPSPAFSYLPAQPNRLSSTTLATPYQPSNDLISGHTLTVSVATGIGEFKSITGYRETNSDEYQDFSANTTITIYRNDPIIVDQHQISQEFQLVGTSDNKAFDYITGVYFFTEKAGSDDTDLIDLYDIKEVSNVTATNTTYAAYGQLTWRPNGNSPWSYTAGARYTEDKRYAENFSTPNGSTSYDNFSPSGIVAYQVTPDANLYAKITDGYKAGGFNWREGNFDNPFGPEKITTYEIGWKTEWLDRRLRWNSAVFYSNYKDIQLDILVPNQPNPTLTETENAGKARVAGVESELDFAVTQALRFQVNYAYLYNDITEVAGDDASLYHLPGAPKNTVNTAVSYDIARLPFGVLNAKADYSWRSESFTAARYVIDGGSTVPSYSIADAYLSLDGDNWVGKGTQGHVQLWVRNLADAQYLTDPFGSFSGLHAIKMTNYGTPRTFGVDFGVKF
jgi:iron complex outermembrane recepter protein